MWTFLWSSSVYILIFLLHNLYTFYSNTTLMFSYLDSILSIFFLSIQLARKLLTYDVYDGRKTKKTKKSIQKTLFKSLRNKVLSLGNWKEKNKRHKDDVNFYRTLCTSSIFQPQTKTTASWFLIQVLEVQCIRLTTLLISLNVRLYCYHMRTPVVYIFIVFKCTTQWCTCVCTFESRSVNRWVHFVYRSIWSFVSHINNGATLKSLRFWFSFTINQRNVIFRNHRCIGKFGHVFQDMQRFWKLKTVQPVEHHTEAWNQRVKLLKSYG